MDTPLGRHKETLTRCHRQCRSCGSTIVHDFPPARYQIRKIFIGTKKLITDVLEKNVPHFSYDTLYLLRLSSCNNRAEEMRQKCDTMRISRECVLLQRTPEWLCAVLHTGQATDTTYLKMAAYHNHRTCAVLTLLPTCCKSFFAGTPTAGFCPHDNYSWSPFLPCIPTPCPSSCSECTMSSAQTSRYIQQESKMWQPVRAFQKHRLACRLNLLL